ncbi:hypothetical protein [Thermoflexus sp.]|uniref:hypothetical protein n=1 Tax=Thermoflexus sp. TaxID=1969742 RepID=UPI0035E41AA3
MELADWQEALKAYREDRSSGAMALAHQAAALVERWAQSYPEGQLTSFLMELDGLLQALREAHPDMAPLLHLIEAARQAVQGASAVPAARAALVAAIQTFQRRLETHERAAARHAASLLRSARVIMIHSRSGMVARTLALAAQRGRWLQVICPIAEPGGEGHQMSEEVAAMGHTAVLLPDFAAAHWIPRVDLVLVGADAWEEEGIVNKIGTLTLAVMARAFQRPFFVVATSEKQWPPWAGPHPTRQEPPSLPGSEIPWFEFVPRSYITGLILEDGLRLT